MDIIKFKSIQFFVDNCVYLSSLPKKYQNIVGINEWININLSPINNDFSTQARSLLLFLIDETGQTVFSSGRGALRPLWRQIHFFGSDHLLTFATEYLNLKL